MVKPISPTHHIAMPAANASQNSRCVPSHSRRRRSTTTHDAAREQQQERVGDDGAGKRVPAQERAGAQVHGGVQDPEDQVSQKGP